jgi:hypothetical protein
MQYLIYSQIWLNPNLAINQAFPLSLHLPMDNHHISKFIQKKKNTLEGSLCVLSVKFRPKNEIKTQIFRKRSDFLGFQSFIH